MRPSALVTVVALALGGCALAQQSSGARAQEAASELNLNARFGRMELASERVSPKAREAFFARRRGWGGPIRIADYELAGMQLKNEDHADVIVKVAWFRVDQNNLNVTTLRQKWQDFKGDWKLVDETRIDGEPGLLGEKIDPPPASANTPRNAQFPSIHIGGEGTVDRGARQNEAPQPAPDTNAAKTPR